MSTPDQKDFPRIAFLLCVLLYATLVAIGFDDIEEDAFIYFRFATNIADGYGYVFNIGGERIEACSGLLWLGLITLLTFLPLHLVLATKLLCFVFGVLCIRQVLVLSQRFIADSRLAVFPACLMVVSIPFYIWSVRGLETAFYWFVMLWLVDWATNPLRIRYWWLPGLALLNARPEGFVMLVAVVPYLFFCKRRESEFWQGAAILASGWLAVMLWRFWYFHDLVPHPFYFKVNPDHAQSLLNLIEYGWYSGWFLLFLLALPALFRPWQSRDFALFGAMLMSLLWAVFVFEDKAFNRHTGIALPFVYISLLLLVDRWWPERKLLRQSLYATLAVLVVFTLAFSRYVHYQDSHRSPFLGNALRALESSGDYWKRVARLLGNPDDFIDKPAGLGVFNIRYNQIAAVGDFIRLNYRPDSVVIYDQIGQAPWYAGRQVFFIDNLGLGYREIGLARFHQSAENSAFYSHYETILENLVRYFWPEEKRLYSNDEIIQRILDRNPDVIVARKAYISNDRENILSMLLKSPYVRNHYQARYLLNNREIFFERLSQREDFWLFPGHELAIPPGSRVNEIVDFQWCEGSPCMELAPEQSSSR